MSAVSVSIDRRSVYDDEERRTSDERPSNADGVRRFRATDRREAPDVRYYVGFGTTRYDNRERSDE